MDASKLSPLGTIRLCGANVYYENQSLCVVADSKEVARGFPDTVTLEEARELVRRGDALWLDKRRGLVAP